MEEVSGTSGKVRRGSFVFDRNTFHRKTPPTYIAQPNMDSKDYVMAMLKSMHGCLTNVYQGDRGRGYRIAWKEQNMSEWSSLRAGHHRYQTKHFYNEKEDV